MRERNSKAMSYADIEDQMTEETLNFIENISNFSDIGGAPKTMIGFVDKIEFFTYISEVIFNSKANDNHEINFSEKEEQVPNT